MITEDRGYFSRSRFTEIQLVRGKHILSSVIDGKGIENLGRGDSLKMFDELEVERRSETNRNDWTTRMSVVAVIRVAYILPTEVRREA